MDSYNQVRRLALQVVLSILMLLVVYPLSVGPVQWLYSHQHGMHQEWRRLRVFKPIARLHNAAPNSIGKCLDWYVECFTGPNPYRTRGGII